MQKMSFSCYYKGLAAFISHLHQRYSISHIPPYILSYCRPITYKINFDIQGG